MHFLVFIPDAKPADLESVAQVSGLSVILDGANVVPCAGPGSGGNGLMLGWTSPTSPLTSYEPDAQDWVPSICRDANGNPRYHVGFWKEAAGEPPRRPPTEAELRRPYTQDGFWHISGSERWKITTPRTVDKDLMCRDDGGWKWQIVREYAWLSDEVEQFHAKYVEDGFLRLQVCVEEDPLEQADWILRLLQINYRMLPEVMSRLRIFRKQSSLVKAFLQSIGIKPRADIMDVLYGYDSEGGA